MQVDSVSRPGVMQMVYAICATTAILFSQAIAANSHPDNLADLAENVSPSVVYITTTAIQNADAEPQMRIPRGVIPDRFREFFENQPRNAPRGPRSALGSGFLISEDGYVVTNYHVIQSAMKISVEMFSGEKFEAEVIGTDPKTDLALLKIDSEESFEYLEFTDSDTARVGDWVMAVGNPLGQEFSVSVGIVSARNRALSGTYDDFIQTDAAINQGNSGGPLLNMDGEVIGVNTAILTQSGGSIGIGFSMASNVVTKVLDQLKEYGETRRGWLGVRIQDVTTDLAEAMGMGDARGALVSDVPDGPAADAGILPGDVILSFNGLEIQDSRNLINIVGDTEFGKTVPVELIRDGEAISFDVKLGRREIAEGTLTAKLSDGTGIDSSPRTILGITLVPVDESLREQHGLNADVSGLLVEDIDSLSDAYDKGIRPNDVILEAAHKPVASVKDIEESIHYASEAGRKAIRLLIQRGDNKRYIALSINDES
ncbi:MAG: Do family serine endopeptidase [Roseovarius sp.]|nr:Do family serine endopeptidase [Roseovarius sp.]